MCGPAISGLEKGTMISGCHDGANHAGLSCRALLSGARKSSSAKGEEPRRSRAKRTLTRQGISDAEYLLGLVQSFFRLVMLAVVVVLLTLFTQFLYPGEIILAELGNLVLVFQCLVDVGHQRWAGVSPGERHEGHQYQCGKEFLGHCRSSRWTRTGQHLLRPALLNAFRQVPRRAPAASIDR